MSEVYGAGSGISQGIQDLHTMGLTALQGVQTQEAQMRLAEAQAEQKAFAQMGGQAGQPGQQVPGGQAPVGAQGLVQAGQPSRGEQISNVGLTLLRAGAPVKGLAMLKEGADITQKEALVRKENLDSQLKEHELHDKKVENLKSLFMGVTSQEGVDRANAMYKMLHNGEDSPVTGLRYSPENIDAVNRGLVKESETNKLEAQKAMQEYRTGLLDLRERQIGQSGAVLQSRSEVLQLRADILRKESGSTQELLDLKKQKAQVELELKKTQSQSVKATIAAKESKFTGDAPTRPKPAPVDPMSADKEVWHKLPNGTVYRLLKDGNVETAGK